MKAKTGSDALETPLSDGNEIRQVESGVPGALCDH